MNRRQFLARVGVAAACTQSLALRAQDGPRYKAAIIGHTGRGDYGHDHDLIFNDQPNVQVVALADPDPQGRAKAAARSRPLRQYADYREMLETEKPDLVCVAPRHTDQHLAMGQAALEVGAHLYMEKPFVQSPAEGDRLLALAAKGRRKIVVAHQIRLGPSTAHLTQAIANGLIGELIQIHAIGKQDQRAGGEDMIVLGSHLFDLMRLFAGDPLWCTARVLQDGKEVTLADVREPTENVGPVLGNDIEAQFAFPNGVLGTFTSRGAYRETAGTWGIQLRGSKGVVRLLASLYPKIYLLKPGSWNGSTVDDSWIPIPGDPYHMTPPAQRGLADANRRLVDDWLEAIQTDREPVCGGYNAMRAIEMIAAVFQAGLSRQRVHFPLNDRGHPLRAAL